jgi:hypothetical protein
MRRRDKEIIDIGECAPLDAVIERLQSLQSSLSDDAQAKVGVEGCDNFGWRLSVTYFREATAEESELESRYMASRLRKHPHRFGHRARF